MLVSNQNTIAVCQIVQECHNMKHQEACTKRKDNMDKLSGKNTNLN